VALRGRHRRVKGFRGSVLYLYTMGRWPPKPFSASLLIPSARPSKTQANTFHHSQFKSSQSMRSLPLANRETRNASVIIKKDGRSLWWLKREFVKKKNERTVNFNLKRGTPWILLATQSWQFISVTQELSVEGRGPGTSRCVRGHQTAGCSSYPAGELSLCWSESSDSPNLLRAPAHCHTALEG